ncbi:MAG TPA: HAMP domain-containing sensor histidine kinase, partial [Magnetospirillum sp.]|nr:HAMP domain-containing sensor histidine kinase [Magnetospirillum sp.]
SHDLRQPLQSLGLFLQIMVERSGAPGSVERAAQQAYDATVRLVDAMFDAAALESGRAKPVIERVDVADVLGRIAAESRAEAEARGLFLRQRLCHVEVDTDKVMLERIVRNLASNALKYTTSGGILIACRTTPNAVRVKVADSGPGIPEDKRTLIFEDFYQIENPERDPRKGLGLGLATVSRMARALGFRFYVLSRKGMGSTFVVEIPRLGGNG